MEQMYFYILLIVALLLIAGLAVAVVYYRRKLDKCMTALVRSINENFEMKEVLLKFNYVYTPYTADLTPREFTRIIHNMLKRLMFLLVLFLFMVCNAHAGEKSDTTYLFRFMSGKDMFYVPWKGNGEELLRLYECVEKYKDEINNGKMPLHVDGYCNSAGSEAENLKTAKMRSNRVKSELIVRKGLKEKHFITRNHSAEGDFVTVRIIVPETPKCVEEVPTDASSGANAVPVAEKVVTNDVVAAKEEVKEEVDDAVAELNVSPKTETIQTSDYQFALRANLLRWATLTPDLGLEWRINRHVGILVNGSWTSWSWDDKNRRYALWEVSPEVRYYIGKEKRGYIGAMYHAGQFNYKLNDTGKQGDLMGGGLTGGYSLKLNRLLSMDFSLGVGCTHADYEKYTVTDGVRIRQSKEKKNYWGVNHAGITLVWKLK